MPIDTVTDAIIGKLDAENAALKTRVTVLEGTLRGLLATVMAFYRSGVVAANYGDEQNRAADGDPSVVAARAALAAEKGETT